MTRREKIEAMLADEPRDVFLRYSLAMELDKEGDEAKAGWMVIRDEFTKKGDWDYNSIGTVSCVVCVVSCVVSCVVFSSGG